MSHASLIVAVDVLNPKDKNEVEAAVAFQMAPYDENGEWFRDASRWDWYEIGGRYAGKFAGVDIVQVKNLGADALIRHLLPRLKESYGRAAAEPAGRPVELIYGFNPSEISEADYLALNTKSPLAAFAFLRERHWHEGERMGWFGSRARTECEIKAVDDPNVLTRRCLTTGNENARIVVWNEPWEIWRQNYWQRFIAPLKPETVLVAVDYHV